MIRFVVALLAMAACGYASNVDNCSWGESYWCSSLENAKTCGAFEHCKSTVWKYQILKADDSEVCDFCKSIILDVTALIKDDRTQQDIMRFMKNACSVIPSKALATECSLLVDQFLVDILNMIIDELKPRSVCALIKLCTGFDDTVVHSHLPNNPEPLPVRLTRVSPLQIRSEPICTDCKKFFTDIKNLILNNATEAEIEALVDQAICSHLGTYEATCKDLVKTYMPEIMLLLSAEFDPNVICQSLGFCTTTLKEAKTFLVKLKLKSSDFYKMASKPSNDAEDGCNICKTVMKDIQDLDRSAAVQRKIEGFLETEICERLGPYKNECVSLIEKFGAYVFELLANELDPVSRCQALGFCAASNAIRDPTRESTPSKSSGQRVADTPECTICKILVEKIDEMIKQNVTKQEILDALDKICSLLPESLRNQCTSFVTQYGPLIIDLLIQEMDPALVCSTLGLCSAKQRTMPSKLSDEAECIVCESAVQYVEALLQENATVAQVEAMLEKICNFVPDKTKSECDFVVQKYGPLIVQYIFSAMTPKAICELVGACETNLIRPVEMVAVKEEKVVKSSYQLLGAIECSWGPKYWCATKENAKQCQATAYCDQIGWEL